MRILALTLFFAALIGVGVFLLNYPVALGGVAVGIVIAEGWSRALHGQSLLAKISL